MVFQPLVRIEYALTRFLNTGVDRNTPTDLVDRIVYSNWVCLIGTLINCLGAQANVLTGDGFLFSWNIVYQIAIVALWALNRKKRYLAGRVVFLTAICIGITITSTAEGTVIQMEHFLLSISALAFTLFHPSEHRWAWAFGGYSALAFLVLVNQSKPLLHLNVSSGGFSAQDLWLNQICYVLLDIFSLIGLSNAYMRAIKLVDVQRAKLFEASRLASLGQMAGGIAHEINNPLAIVDALSEKLIQKSKLQPLTQEEIQSNARDLQETTQRIVRIVQGLKKFSRDGNQLPFEHKSLNPIIDDTVSLCQERFRLLKINLKITKTARDHRVKCRSVQISQVLLNILNNAYDAIQTHDAPWIEVFAFESQFQVHVRIRNSGPKISKSIQEKIFQPFFTTKEVGQGTGLGLSISQAIMKERGGSLELEQHDTHTSFILSLSKA